jgi:hypothetical protein
MPLTPRLEDAPAPPFEAGSSSSALHGPDEAHEAQFMHALNGRFRPDVSMGGKSRTGSHLFVAAAARPEASAPAQPVVHVRTSNDSESELPWARHGGVGVVDESGRDGHAKGVQVHPQYRVPLPQGQPGSPGSWRLKTSRGVAVEGQGQVAKAGRGTDVSPSQSQAQTPVLKTKKSAVLMHKLSRAFGLKKKDKGESVGVRA